MCHLIIVFSNSSLFLLYTNLYQSHASPSGVIFILYSVSIIHLQHFTLLYTWSITNKWQFYSLLSLEHIGYYVLNYGLTFLQVSEFSFTCLLLCRPLRFHLDEFYCVSSMSQDLLDLIPACTLSPTTILYVATGK